MPTITTVDATWDTGVTLDAAELRRADSAMFLGDGTANGVRGGIVRHGDSSLAVSVNGSDQVTVQPGAFVIPAATGLGAYRGSLSAATSAVAISTRNATNPRIDLVVIQVDGTSATMKTIDGTPGASPSAPALPAQHIELARLTVPAVGGGAVTVDSTWRSYAASLGGTLYVETSARLPGSGNQRGQKAVALNTGVEYAWTGSAWANNGTPSWSSFSPALSGTGTSQGNIAYTTREYVIGRGGMVDFYSKVTLGSTTVLGSVNYIALPVALLAIDALGAIDVVYNDASGGSYAGSVRAFDTAKLLLYYGNLLAPVTPTVPFTWAAGDSIEVRGRYRAAL